MRKHRNTLIYTGIFLTFGSAWFAVTVWKVLAWPLIYAGAIAVAAVAQCGQSLISRRLDRPGRGRRRAHARTRPTHTRKAT